ncbi:hypothetical protein [Saccharothrix lopnurensis]|uniref:Uncharacterized protein n=1 Tax=Saccharothrix lopnurensis TaxID=1670621 RepID=A0ABW1PFL4_9PSEU
MVTGGDLVAMTEQSAGSPLRAPAGGDRMQDPSDSVEIAESMTIPDAGREELQRRRHASIEASEKNESIGTRPPGPIESKATS